MNGLTPRQQEILAFLDAFRFEEGRSPSLREVGDHFGISPAAVHYAFRALAKKGALSLEEGLPRGTSPTKEERGQRENIPIPFYPEEPTQEELSSTPENILYVSRSLSSLELLAFRVTSLSMKEGGILPGDTAIVRRSSKAKNGDIVLASALTDSEARLELRIYRRDRNLEELWPENDTMGIIRSQKVAIYGILFEVRRSY